MESRAHGGGLEWGRVSVGGRSWQVMAAAAGAATLVAALATLSSGAAPRAGAQRVPLVGYLSEGFGPNPLNAAFWDEMRTLGWVDGETIRVETRYAQQSARRIYEASQYLVGLQPDAIMGARTWEAAGPLALTRAIPIVTAGSSDPFGLRLAESAERPGGTVTGLYQLTPEYAAGRLTLVKELMPGLVRLGVLWDANDRERPLDLRLTQEAARSLRIELVLEDVRGESDYARAFAAAADGGAEAILLLGSLQVNWARPRIVEVASGYALPLIAAAQPFVEEGAVMAYFPNQEALFRRAAHYMDRVLRGANPAEMPMEGPRAFDLLLNPRAAAGHGLSVPPRLVAQATLVVE